MKDMATLAIACFIAGSLLGYRTAQITATDCVQPLIIEKHCVGDETGHACAVRFKP